MKKIMKMADKFIKACLVFTSVFILGVGCKNIEDFKVDNFGSSSEELVLYNKINFCISF